MMKVATLLSLALVALPSAALADAMSDAAALNAFEARESKRGRREPLPSP